MLLAAAGAGALWWLLGGRAATRAPTPDVEAELAEPPAPSPRPLPPPRPPAARPPAAAPVPDDDPVHPHPITAAHQLVFRENALIGAINGAMDVKDARGLRELLDQYRREYPEDPSQLQEGYRIIADCLDNPGAASTAAAQRYCDVERGSTLRRFVGRHCLENGD